MIPTSPVAIDGDNDSELHLQQDHSNGESTEKEILLLPAGKPDSDTTTTTHIQLDGDAVPLRELGPIIINRDGTTRRITNWHDLTPAEQDSSWRVIAARNKRRILALKQKQQQQQQSQEGTQEDVDATNDNDAPPQDLS